MTAFIIIATIMLAAALVAVLVPLLRHASAPAFAQEASNLAILRDQLAELEADLANGTITREHHDQARRELEQRVLEDTRAVAATGAGPAPFAGAWTAAIVASALPIAAMLLYFVLGSHEAFSPTARTTATAAADAAQHDLSPQKMEEMAGKLAARLEKEPGNVEGWSILAHTYYTMKRFPQAVDAYEHAAKLQPDNADLLADYADALGATTNSLEGKPLELIDRALKANPTQWKALALAGTVAFNHKDFKQAVVYWEQLKQTVPPESDMARSIDASIAEAKELGGIKTAAAPPAPAALPAPDRSPAAAPAAPPAASASPGAGITGTIALSPALAATAAPNDTVFIFARAAQGPKFPLAIVRKQVKDLPTPFSLDDSMAMSPEMKMSNFAEVVVGARVAKSGNATPQSGDLEGFSRPVKLGAGGVAVVIDTARP